LYLDLNTSAYT